MHYRYGSVSSETYKNMLCINFLNSKTHFILHFSVAFNARMHNLDQYPWDRKYYFYGQNIEIRDVENYEN